MRQRLFATVARARRTAAEGTQHRSGVLTSRPPRARSHPVTVHLMVLALVLAQPPAPAAAQPRPKIAIALEARTEGKPEPDASAAKLLEEVRRGFAVIPDIEIVPSDGSRRTIWIITGATPGVAAASLM